MPYCCSCFCFLSYIRRTVLSVQITHVLNKMFTFFQTIILRPFFGIPPLHTYISSFGKAITKNFVINDFFWLFFFSYQRVSTNFPAFCAKVMEKKTLPKCLSEKSQVFNKWLQWIFSAFRTASIP